MTIRKPLGLLGGAFAVTAALMVLSSPASAAPYSMEFTDARGETPTAQSDITATFTDVGTTGVMMTLTMGPLGSTSYEDEYIQNLWLNYSGDVGDLSHGTLPPEITDVTFTQDGHKVAQLGWYDIAIDFSNPNNNGGAVRLNGGEQVSLLIQGADDPSQFAVMSVDGNTNYYGLVKVGGIGPQGNDSIRLGALEVAPVPIPAAGLLIAPALLGLMGVGAWRRRRDTTAPA